MQSVRTLREIGQRQEKLRRQDLALRRREAKLRAERTALRTAARRLSREETAQRALLAELEDLIGALKGRALMRRVMHLRYVEGLTVPQIRAALDAEGLCYGERHIDRVLRGGEKALAAEWSERKEKKP